MGSTFWAHLKAVLTPHNAADTDPDEISIYVARQIERFEAGGALENVVDRERGYQGSSRRLSCVPANYCPSWFNMK